MTAVQTCPDFKRSPPTFAAGCACISGRRARRLPRLVGVSYPFGSLGIHPASEMINIWQGATARCRRAEPFHL